MFTPFFTIARNITTQHQTPSILTRCLGRTHVLHNLSQHVSSTRQAFHKTPHRAIIPTTTTSHSVHTGTSRLPKPSIPNQYIIPRFTNPHPYSPPYRLYTSFATIQSHIAKTLTPYLSQLTLRKLSLPAGGLSFLATGFWSKAASAAQTDGQRQGDRHKASSTRVDVYSLQFYRDINETHTFARGAYPYHTNLSDLTAVLTSTDPGEQFIEISELLQNDLQTFQSQREQLLETYSRFTDQYQLHRSYMDILSSYIEEFNSEECLDKRDLNFVLKLADPISENCSSNVEDLLKMLNEAISSYNLLAQRFNSTTDRIDEAIQQIAADDPLSKKNEDGSYTLSDVFSADPESNADFKQLLEDQKECVDHLRRFHLHFQNSARALLDRGLFRANILAQRYIPIFKSLKIQMHGDDKLKPWLVGIDRIFRDLDLHQVNRPRLNADGQSISDEEREEWLEGLNMKFSDAVHALAQILEREEIAKKRKESGQPERKRLIDVLNNPNSDDDDDDDDDEQKKDVTTSNLSENDIANIGDLPGDVNFKDDIECDKAIKRRVLPLEELQPSKIIPELSNVYADLQPYITDGIRDKEKIDMIKLKATRVPLEEIEALAEKVHHDLYVAVSVFNEYIKHNFKIIAEYNKAVRYHTFCSCYLSKNSNSPADLRFSRKNRDLLDTLPPYDEKSPLILELEIALGKTQNSLNEQMEFLSKVHTALDEHRHLLDGMMDQIAMVYQARQQKLTTPAAISRMTMLEDRTKQSVLSGLAQVSYYTREYSLPTIGALNETLQRYYDAISPTFHVSLNAIQNTYAPLYEEASKIVEKYNLRYHLPPEEQLPGADTRDAKVKELFSTAERALKELSGQDSPELLSSKEKRVRKAISSFKKEHTPAEHEQFVRGQIFRMKQKMNKMPAEKKYRFHKKKHLQQEAEVRRRMQELREEQFKKRLEEMDEDDQLAKLYVIAQGLEDKLNKMSPAEKVEYQRRNLENVLATIQGLPYDERTALFSRHPDFLGNLMNFLPDGVLEDMLDNLEHELRLRKKLLRLTLTRSREEWDDEVREYQISLMDEIDPETDPDPLTIEAVSDLEESRNAIQQMMLDRKQLDAELGSFESYLNDSATLAQLPVEQRKQVVSRMAEKIQLNHTDFPPTQDELLDYQDEIIKELSLQNYIRKVQREDKSDYGIPFKFSQRHTQPSD